MSGLLEAQLTLNLSNIVNVYPQAALSHMIPGKSKVREYDKVSSKTDHKKLSPMRVSDVSVT